MHKDSRSARTSVCEARIRATPGVRRGAIVFTLLGAITVAPVCGAATLAERYRVADDLSGFVVQRAALPAEGSYFYSYLARRECRVGVGVVRLLTETFHRVVRPDIADDMARQLKRCANLPRPDDATAAFALENADVQAGLAAGDKYFAAMAWTPGGTLGLFSDEDVRRALRFFATTDDRNMRALELEEFFAGTMTLQGRPLSADQARAFQLAMQLTGCALGVEDGGHARPMGGLLTLGGGCESSDPTAVRKRLSDQPAPFKPDWSLVDAYQAQLLAAIRSGDWSAFGAASAASRATPSPVAHAATTAPR